LSGEKKEEYRDIKSYWMRRLIPDKHRIVSQAAVTNLALPNGFFKHFDVVKFTNGYGKDAPSFLIECKGVEVSEGLQEWGAIPDVRYFTIKLGKILEPLK
jgi:hypothetical protein